MQHLTITCLSLGVTLIINSKYSSPNLFELCDAYCTVEWFTLAESSATSYVYACYADVNLNRFLLVFFLTPTYFVEVNFCHFSSHLWQSVFYNFFFRSTLFMIVRHSFLNEHHGWSNKLWSYKASELGFSVRGNEQRLRLSQMPCLWEHSPPKSWIRFGLKDIPTFQFFYGKICSRILNYF